MSLKDKCYHNQSINNGRTYTRLHHNSAKECEIFIDGYRKGIIDHNKDVDDTVKQLKENIIEKLNLVDIARYEVCVQGQAELEGYYKSNKRTLKLIDELFGEVSE